MMPSVLTVYKSASPGASAAGTYHLDAGVRTLLLNTFTMFGPTDPRPICVAAPVACGSFWNEAPEHTSVCGDAREASQPTFTPRKNFMHRGAPRSAGKEMFPVSGQ